ncbi:hypothetical protein [Dokdonia sp.]|uniref:hypothetical protein n=1 Tax=Dokdonia sp. TaxID=2024995 RepID=UPI00326301DA
MKKNEISFRKFIISRISDLNNIQGGNGPTGDGNNTTNPQAPAPGKVRKCINDSADWVEEEVPNGQGNENQ